MYHIECDTLGCDLKHIFVSNAFTGRPHTAPETSRRRILDPCTPLLFDLYHYLEQNGYLLVPEHTPGPSSQVLPGCRVRHPCYSKKLFVRLLMALLLDAVLERWTICCSVCCSAQCVAVCVAVHSVLQCVLQCTVCCSVKVDYMLQCVAVCCSVFSLDNMLQCVAVYCIACCSVLHCVLFCLWSTRKASSVVA